MGWAGRTGSEDLPARRRPAEDAPGRAAREQTAQPALEQAAKSTSLSTSLSTAAQHATKAAAVRRAGVYPIVAGSRGLIAAEMLDPLVGKQCQDRHGDRRHAAACGSRLAARAIAHAVENVEQAHVSLLRADQSA